MISSVVFTDPSSLQLSESRTDRSPGRLGGQTSGRRLGKTAGRGWGYFHGRQRGASWPSTGRISRPPTNGAPLPQQHGFPVRLIAPGWYGIANTKWLQRIEVLPTRYENRFMARDYVTIREQRIEGQSVWTETSVGRAMLKSAPAKVTRAGGQYRIIGAAWGAPIAQVEVQIDGGPWLPATIDEGEDAEFAWKLWSLEWSSAAAGEHAITSRAIDTDGHIQPAQDDPWIAGKHTYWESNGQVTRRVRVP